ncbi:MAG: Thioredoxin-dependent 5-adenylylsulfate reductase [Pseudomonadota bacterium]
MTPELTARTERARAILNEAAREFSPAVLALSLGAEDMVLLDLAARDRLPIGAFLLDTGRLPGETLDLLKRVRARYRVAIDVFQPDEESLVAFYREHSDDRIFQSVAARKACCHARKVVPLGRALAGKGAWITGLRRSQSATRTATPEKAWDGEHGLYKFNPLAAWSADDVWAYIRNRDVPYNPLHDRGYASIGCAPCTRAISPGEDERAGRWWWEVPESRECGLHPGYFEGKHS